jgi:ABC-2 type transport system ATP-binding protein
MIVQINRLSKSYGTKIALNEISLEIVNGMFGLLGPNGAGKTTLMRILATLLHKNSGTVSIDGIAIENRRAIRRLIGYMPQEFSFYPSLSVYEAMDYLAILSGVTDRIARKKLILELLERVNLKDCLKLNVKALSGGMKRRLGIAQALLNNPGLLIVDEPTAGLDPEERMRFRNMLTELAQQRAIILSTHIVGDIESVCKNLAVLKEGTLLYSGKVNELLRQADGKVWTAFVENEFWENMKATASTGIRTISSVPEGQQMKLRILSDGKPFEAAEPVAPCMEDAYILLVKEASTNVLDADTEGTEIDL